MAAIRYAADADAAFAAVEMEGLCLLFHQASGMTHILAPPAPQILEALREGPADAATILARLADSWELESGTGEAVAARLAELEAAGLVARA